MVFLFSALLRGWPWVFMIPVWGGAALRNCSVDNLWRADGTRLPPESASAQPCLRSVTLWPPLHRRPACATIFLLLPSCPKWTDIGSWLLCIRPDDRAEYHPTHLTDEKTKAVRFKWLPRASNLKSGGSTQWEPNLIPECRMALLLCADESIPWLLGKARYLNKVGKTNQMTLHGSWMAGHGNECISTQATLSAGPDTWPASQRTWSPVCHVY